MKRLNYTLTAFFLAVGLISLNAQDITHPSSGTSNFTVTQGTTVMYFDDGGEGCDDGTPDGSYSNNQMSTAIICPDVAGSSITIEFLEVDIETRSASIACWDYLRIYDGNSTAGNLLFEGCGEDGFQDCSAGGGFDGDGSDGGATEGGPNDINGTNTGSPANNLFTSTATNGCLTVEFDTDGSVDQGGWIATASASSVTAGPTCDDGIQNGDETGVDCGGSCAPCVTPPTCDDGIQNGDEEGVDCGGSNCAPCPVVVCVEPVASATVTSYCGPGVFMVMVNLGDLGSANAVSISNDGGQPALQNVFFPRRYFVGPFSVGEVVNITIADQNDPSCSIVLEGLAADCNMGLAGAGNLSGVSAQTDISVFPNPTAGDVNVNLGSIFGQEANIRIMNAVGQLIEERQIDAVENVTERFDLSNQQAGMYFIHVDVAGGESHVERVILGTARP
jgi:hypothetical protein